MVTVIYSWSLSNYLREGKDEGFDWFGLNRFGGGLCQIVMWNCWISCSFCCDVNRILAPWQMTLFWYRSFLAFGVVFFFYFIKVYIGLMKPFLKASKTHLETRLVSFVIHRFVQDRKIWFQRFEVLDVGDSKLGCFLIKIRASQPYKRIGINKRLFRPARSTADGQDLEQ